MLGFNKTSVLKEAWARYERTTGGLPSDKPTRVLVDCHYPGNERRAVKDIAATFRAGYLDLGENRGVLGNYNEVFRRLAFKDEDVLAFFDPDSHPMQQGWLIAAAQVIRNGAGYVTLSRKNPDVVQESPVEDVGGFRCRRLVRACSWPMGIWHGGFCKQGVPFLALDGNGKEFPHYGFTENDMLRKFEQLGRPGYMLEDYQDFGHEDPAVQGTFDHSYTCWKVESAWGRTQLGYAEWLASQHST